MYISLVINADSRPQRDAQNGLFSGVVNEDFLTDGIFNKIKFFDGFEKEVILFLDEHQHISDKNFDYMRSMVDTLVIRKHDKRFGDIKEYGGFNDLNYLQAIALARGEIICHADQDTAMFTPSPQPIHDLIKLLDEYKFVSYPSHWTPKPVDDPSFGNRTWASTRFFMCKRETIKFDTLLHCLQDSSWAYETFGDSPRKCNWLEHFLTLTNNDSCFYPPIEYEKYLIFCWENYEQYTLRRLNEMPYDEVKNWVLKKGGIFYPNHVKI
jgi:hypothetical protein